MGISSTIRAIADRSAKAIAGRSAFGNQSRPATVFPSSSQSSTIPHYREPSPRDMIVEQRRNRNIVRSMYRINPVIKSIVDKKVEIYVGDGPVPDSLYKDLVKLWKATEPFIDNRGQYDFGGWFANEVARNFYVDGDVGIRVRDRRNRARWSNLQVPMQLQALTVDWMPDDYVGPWKGNVGFVNGVAIDDDVVQAYAIYNEHPGDATRLGRIAQLYGVPANEVYHLFRSSTGFGLNYDEMLRTFAEDAARQATLGIKVQSAEWMADTTIAKMILAEVEKEELHEREMIAAAKLDASVIPGSID